MKIVAVPILAVLAVVLVSGCTNQYQQLVEQGTALKMTQDDIQIKSVSNSADNPCPRGESYYQTFEDSWHVDGFVLESVIPEQIRSDYKASLDCLNLVFEEYIDGNSEPYIYSGTFDRACKNVANNQPNGDYNFYLPLGRMSLNSGHVVNLCFSVSNPVLNITSNRLCKQYQVTKLCD